VIPEDALHAAREAAAAARAQGAYADDLAGLRIEPTNRVDPELMMDWAVAEPDVDMVRSTRKLGQPITWVKRGLIHAMRQYQGQVIATQGRFNLHLMIYLAELEDRIRTLEEELRAARAGGGDPAP
jgi:hypothetical protein